MKIKEFRINDEIPKNAKLIQIRYEKGKLINISHRAIPIIPLFLEKIRTIETFERSPVFIYEVEE